MKVTQGSRGNAPPDNLKRGGKYYQGKASVIEPGFRSFKHFFELIGECIAKTEISANGYGKTLEAVLKQLQAQFRKGHKAGGRVIFVGNGGSAAIASHNAIDWTKNGGIRSIAFNDAAALTCWANDAGYSNVFAKQIEHHATEKDSLVIISSSGRSLNVLAAADAARVKGCQMILTLTGLNPNNVLRAKGDVNLWVPSSDYGLVELAHMSILHSIVSVGT